MADPQRIIIDNLEPILVDSDSFIALVKEDDDNHQKAKEYFAQLDELPVMLVTTKYVFAEVATVLSQRVSHAVSIQFVDTLLAEPQAIKFIDAHSDSIFDSAVDFFKKQSSKNVSFVDCTNMAVMQNFNIRYIFSFDKTYKTNNFMYAEDYVRLSSQAQFKNHHMTVPALDKPLSFEEMRDIAWEDRVKEILKKSS